MFFFLAKFSWMLGLIFAAWEHYSWVIHKDEVLARNPELAPTYDRVMWGQTIFYSLPWAIVGLGILSGSVENIFDFLRPRSGNGFVLAFFLVIIVSVLFVSVWVWLFGGATYLSPYMKKSAKYIKIQFALITLFMFVWTAFAFILQGDINPTHAR